MRMQMLNRKMHFSINLKTNGFIRTFCQLLLSTGPKSVKMDFNISLYQQLKQHIVIGNQTNNQPTIQPTSQSLRQWQQCLQ